MVVLWLEEINLLEQFNTKLIVLLHYQFLFYNNIYESITSLAGLSRLLTARLQNKGLYIEIEARNRIGGRIHTINTAQVESKTDLFNDIHVNSQCAT
jgi:hypothetical protein